MPGMDFVSLHESWTPSTQMGWAMGAIIGAMAQFERDGPGRPSESPGIGLEPSLQVTSGRH